MKNSLVKLDLLFAKEKTKIPVPYLWACHKPRKLRRNRERRDTWKTFLVRIERLVFVPIGNEFWLSAAGSIGGLGYPGGSVVAETKMSVNIFNPCIQARHSKLSQYTRRTSAEGTCRQKPILLAVPRYRDIRFSFIQRTTYQPTFSHNGTYPSGASAGTTS